jgi:catechol 2,3-dioxygenase-like lactoylglutathione lyase family enzyme
LVTDDIEAALRVLQERHYQLVSPGVVTLPKAEIGFHFAVIVRDPDGHPIELAKK